MKKKVALVSGATRGIGFGIAVKFAERGFDLVISGTREKSLIADVIEKLQKLGSDVLYCRCDISSSEQRADMIKNVKKHFGRLNVLVNNAGAAPSVRSDILDLSEENYEKIMKINLQGPYFLTQAVAKWMIEQKKMAPEFTTSVINITSISSETASINRGEYCISKAGLSMATKLWAVRLSEFDIPVYEVRPGIILTDMTSGVKDKYDKLISEGILLQKRWGTTEDVAKTVVTLAEGNMPYSTGQIINVDGGFSISRL
jgi:NAD(P)-dependent dehydrogenase (short-subunit alcohol dehydrogenase family)